MEEIRAFIAFSRLRSISRSAKRQVAEGVRHVASLFEGDDGTLSGAARQEIFSFKGWGDIDSELAALRERGAEVITIKDNTYPELLKNIPDPPLVLYKKGSLSLEQNAVAIVGSRRASEESMNLSEKIADTLSSLGITVISGLARGVDAAAHRGALTGSGKTIAVLGCGLDICYPWENKRLYQRVGEEGAVLTEYGLGERPLAYHFPERNRIIAGLSKGVLVIEAAKKSGSLITARLGAEYGRSVMAIPGSIFSEEYTGTNALIKQGAKLVDSIEDVIAECFPGLTVIRKKPIDLDGNEDYIYSIVGPRRIHVDEVIEKSKMAAKEVMAILTVLEMKDAIREVAGGFYIRK
ncbi:MAG: DNA-processing protein DprA [Syntrophobacterales bacterium]|jgi:DNA processing protein|nr:DNA-processing protein DprA [Syntrophobacterales bacterium]